MVAATDSSVENVEGRTKTVVTIAGRKMPGVAQSSSPTMKSVVTTSVAIQRAKFYQFINMAVSRLATVAS
jgi:hypothetical protein